MKVVKSENCNVLPGVEGLEMRVLFGGAADMGAAVFSPGVRVPPEGAVAHDRDEYAYVISGSIDSCSGGVSSRIEAGSASFIPAGEEHYSYNGGEEECVLVYMLVKPE